MTATKSLAAQLRHPKSWRVSTRRLFLLCAPIAVPVYLVLLLVFGIVFMFGKILEPIRAFWSDPPKRVRESYHEYGYVAGRPGDEEDDSRKIVLLRFDENRKQSA